MRVVIVDPGSGNLHSVHKALEEAGRICGLSVSVIPTDDPEEVARADRLVLPGQGAFMSVKDGLKRRSGLIEALTEAVRDNGRPFFGICVGMQLLADFGVEHGQSPGLGWIKGCVTALDDMGGSLRIPHMGWNDLCLTDSNHPVLAGLIDGDHAYFVHSFAFHADNPSDVLATTAYGEPITAIIGRDTMVATQFHAEKSQVTGLRMLANFLSWTP